MIRTFRTARKTLVIRVCGNRVVVTQEKAGRRSRYAPRFANRYALRKFLSARVSEAIAAGFQAA